MASCRYAVFWKAEEGKKKEKKKEEEIHLAFPLVGLEIGLFDWRIRAPQKNQK
jgi:hypothetical protein